MTFAFRFGQNAWQGIPEAGNITERTKVDEDVAMIGKPFVIEEITDPAETARAHAQFARARRNSQWLQTHWDELLPQARGKFLAVAGQEAFIAETPQEAWALAEAAHPEDDGALVQYVRLEPRPRFYANQG